MTRDANYDVDLLLTADADLARDLVSRWLRPILELSDRERARMVPTLQAWLAYPNRPQAVADRLGVHVQTVRYRVDGLRELLGEAVDDPVQRFGLAVALQTARLTGAVPAT